MSIAEVNGFIIDVNSVDTQAGPLLKAATSANAANAKAIQYLQASENVFCKLAAVAEALRESGSRKSQTNRLEGTVGVQQYSPGTPEAYLSLPKFDNLEWLH